MIDAISIPSEVGVISLRGCVLFPQAMMPLFIFEPRYRQMLADALAEERIFAVATLDEAKVTACGTDEGEPTYKIATVGMVRACKKNEDGTANLILQGLSRVRFDEIITDEPYRRASITVLRSTDNNNEDQLAEHRERLLHLIVRFQESGGEVPGEIIEFLRSISDHEAMLDLAVYALCASPVIKQTLLETLSVTDRFDYFAAYLLQQTRQLRIINKLKEDLNEDDIAGN